MSKFSTHVIETSSQSGRTSRFLCVFASSSNFAVEELDAAIAEVLINHAVLDGVRIVGDASAIGSLRNVLSEESALRERLKRAIQSLERSSVFICFDPHACSHVAHDLAGNSLEDGPAIVEITRRHMLLVAFEAANGVVQAPRGFHYVKPSQKHSNAFLRTSNVLEEGIHAPMLAFWLMPYLSNRPIRRIVVDTSAIASLAWTVGYEAKLQGVLAEVPFIETHRSYGGLEKLRLLAPEETILLISASTSGGLAGELVKRGAIPENIVTLFYLGTEKPSAGHVLCDLTRDDSRHSVGLPPIRNYDMETCPYCQESSFPVRIEGDQFTLEPPRAEEVFLSKDDLPYAQAAIFNRFAGTGLFMAYRTVDEMELEIFLNVAALFPSCPPSDARLSGVLSEFRSDWDRLVSRGLLVHLERIICSNYPFSRELAELALATVRKTNPSPTTEVIDARQLRHVERRTSSAALVITSCLDDAQEMMGINRDLRDVQPRGNTTYLTPFFRSTDQKQRDRICSNLTFGEHGAGTFSLFRLVDIDLPRNQRQHSWLLELEALRETEHWADQEGIEVPKRVLERIRLLEEAPKNGLADELFWNGLSGKPLKVRADFTLIDTDGGAREVSQGDVFAVVSALLHRLREGVPKKPRLIWKTYERGIISPDNFERFNDGVVQAALLRAARDYELSYANVDSDPSSRIKELLLSQIRNAGKGEGEAFMEFLVALLCRRLIVAREHTQEICNGVLGASGLPEHAQFVARYILEVDLLIPRPT